MKILSLGLYNRCFVPKNESIYSANSEFATFSCFDRDRAVSPERFLDCYITYNNGHIIYGTRTRSVDTARSKHENVANSDFALYQKKVTANF